MLQLTSHTYLPDCGVQPQGPHCLQQCRREKGTPDHAGNYYRRRAVFQLIAALVC